MTYLAHIADEVLNTPLAIDPRKAATIAAVLGTRIGLDGDIKAFARDMPGPALSQRHPGGTGSPSGYSKGAGIAVISIIGTLVTRGSFLETQSGLMSYDRIKQQVAAADRDEEVTSILLDIHTAGGSCLGCFECCEMIHAVSRRRPVIAVVNSMACSAGYSIAAAANKIVIPPSGLCGSIGVVYLHIDRSRQLHQDGLTPTFIFTGKHKIDANEFQPLSDAARSDAQAEIDSSYDQFVKGLAKHRPKLSEAAYRATEAKVYKGAEAVGLGLADEIGTIEGVASQLANLHPVVRKTKYDLTRAVYGELQANHEKLQDAQAAGIRIGMAAALAGRS